MVYLPLVALFLTSIIRTSTQIGSPNSKLLASTPNFWFSFGDSYTRTNFDPSSTPPNPSNHVGNPPFPGQSATGGPNWLGYLTGTYNNTLIYTYNYAYGGATIDSTIVPPFLPFIVCMDQQVTQFLDGAGKGGPGGSVGWTSENALFSFWIGINNIGSTWSQSGDRGAFSDKLIEAYFKLVQKLYDAGARNFLFIDVPPVDRSPSVHLRKTRFRWQVKVRTPRQLRNPLLSGTTVASHLSFQTAHPEVKTWIYSSWDKFTKILDSPISYGFKDSTSYGSGQDIFWGDNYHPSAKANNYFAQDIRDILNSTIW